jgi:prophage regulatory protein
MHLATDTRPQVRRDRLLRLPDVEAATGLKKSTIYLLMKRDEFPRSIQITPRCVAWAEASVLQWIQDRIAAAAQLELPATSPAA